ncbi:hypothetical protein IAG44_12520 [Streptomyces roseirectus]|uniref:arginine--tRNA ligase n=1 Tax=Streptomyces roseirectus TaxID=2768066 RepID=A0A7H0IBM8_9ACTN|nr:DALR anticodon-binding domain-containing protein [Streptomyces roseirectus]QNP70194.1 hypothetical protein IAG44_12520 [Streptomyces roseirectus]
MTPAELSRTVLRAVRRAVDGGELRVEVPARAVVTPPGPGGVGDYATPIALKLARPAGRPPMSVAEILRTHLAQAPGVRDVAVTPPGFLNITLADTSPVAEILRTGPRYGHADAPTGETVHLHAPHELRAVVVMDALARVLRSQGARVRTSCESRPAPEWTSLGVEIDEYGAVGEVNVRPVPAPLPHLDLGRDATRWALLHPALHDHPRLTPDHLAQRETNPLFRVRYAHARTRALTRNAAALGFTSSPAHPDPRPPGVEGPPPGVPATPAPEAPLAAPLATHAPGVEGPPPGALATSALGSPLAAPLAPKAPGVEGPRPGAPATSIPGAPLAASAPEAALATPLAASAPGAEAHPAGPPGTPTPPTPHPLETLLADHPRILTTTATHHTPHRLTHHLLAIADTLLPLLPYTLPTGEEKPEATHRTRLALAEAAGAVLAGGLTLLGIDAPEHL